MDLIMPGVGLIFWTSIIFIILLLILGKVAWKPINKMINNRNQSIEDALNMAEKAREEMKQLKAGNEQIMIEARIERDNILKEARELKEQIVAEAKQEAGKEVEKLKKNASMEIAAQKAAAVEEIRNQVLDLSILVAEKVIRREVKDKKDNQVLVDDILKDVKFN
ncbi:MAG: F0F1 ATP synthase subunit B [Bacteroidota bacterium]|jgi:F-type H+-transporting ATPase subunit b|nr:F0F1 ATP synthase subunit B [Bacteroidota bacterium]OQC44791.1 MAG: ATP synthase subunit b [Bacteroidetes bacterium ADurb.Bin028]HOD89112.1 F0F1 ATP synthase subunit B [Bacteroidales bacterium]HOE39276.1 F0F1 ATP synthase subunit B [Bacteroidales bacterium]HOR60782.1 F0F1 ATP synthase subunit B [Bacteroidales bacterium]